MEDKKIVQAKSKFIRLTPRKVRLIVDMIRGRNALEAINILQYVNKAAAEPVRKTVESCVANAANNFEMDKKKLIICEAMVDVAPTFKRWRAASKGRGRQIMKRNCHVTIKVIERG